MRAAKSAALSPAMAVPVLFGGPPPDDPGLAPEPAAVGGSPRVWLAPGPVCSAANFGSCPLIWMLTLARRGTPSTENRSMSSLRLAMMPS